MRLLIGMGFGLLLWGCDASGERMMDLPVPQPPAADEVAGVEPVAPATISFEDAPAARPFAGTPAPVDLDSHVRARQFRTALARGAAEGPNFAGHYTVVTWGCGTMCQEFMIVDARNGEVFDGRTTALGVDYRLNSRLLIVNPSGRVEPDACPPTACTPQFLLWDGSRLLAVLEDDEREAIRRATIDYVRRETQIQDVTVEIEAVADGWARVRVSPADDVTDPAIVYLRKEAEVWHALAIGTAFAPDDLDRLGVPESVRPRP